MDMSFTLGIFWYVVFAFSTVLHEYAHVIVGLYLGGGLGAKDARLTLDPYYYMKREPFGMVILPIIFLLTNGMLIGWASVPYNPIWAMKYPKKAALMSLAGPLTNLLLAIFAIIVSFCGVLIGVFKMGEYNSFSHLIVASHSGVLNNVATLLSIMVILNLSLFVFNMIPFYPLDGSSAISLILPPSLYARFRMRIFNPQFHIFGMFISFMIFNLLIGPIYTVALRLIGLADNF